MPKRFGVVGWMLIAGVLTLGIEADDARPLRVPAPRAPAAVAEAGAVAGAVAVEPATATPFRPTTDASVAGSETEAAPTPPPPDTVPATVPATHDLSTGPPYVVATSSAPIAVHQGPDEGSSARLLDPATAVAGQLVFLVKQDGHDWLEVYLPVRPNGSTGWLRAENVELYEHDYRIELSLSRHRLVLFQGASVVMDEPIGVGAGRTPTPGGVYYLKELLRPPDPAGFYGPYAYGLSGFSDVLVDYAGGEGVLGLHGTNDPSSVGRNSSNGCIRLHNAAITRLVEDVGLPLGTPVIVRA